MARPRRSTAWSNSTTKTISEATIGRHRANRQAPCASLDRVVRILVRGYHSRRISLDTVSRAGRMSLKPASRIQPLQSTSHACCYGFDAIGRCENLLPEYQWIRCSDSW